MNTEKKIFDITQKVVSEAINDALAIEELLQKCMANEGMVYIAGYYNGFLLVTTNDITKKVQRRSHRKHRINKKWLKRYGYKQAPDDKTILQFENIIFGTPKCIEKIIEKVKKEE